MASPTWLDNVLVAATNGRSSWKPPVKVVATASVTLSGLQTIDGQALSEGDAVLLTGQSGGTGNGPYLASSGSWSRRYDWVDSSTAQSGSRWRVLSGTTYGSTEWYCSNAPGTITVGGTAVTIVIDVANASTALATPSTLVARDSSGASAFVTVSATTFASSSANVAQSGTIRVPNNVTGIIVGRLQALSGDFNILSTDSLNEIIVGGASNGGVYANSPSFVAFNVNGAERLRANTTGVSFFGATPVAQPARAGQLTDSTGGSATSTLAAGITDTVAKNAIASLAAKVNALETIIHNLGLSA